MRDADDRPTPIYGDWASVYERFDGEAARATWREGVVPELRRLGAGGNSRILDLGAGTGIGRRELTRAFPGCRVVSLDQSEAMLRAGGVPEEDRIVGDMGSFVLPDASFDFVVSGFDALNYLTEERLRSCFASVAAVLAPGGGFVFDYSSRQVLKYDWGDLRYVSEQDGLRLERVHLYEPEHDRTRIDLALEADGGAGWAETHYHHSVDPYTIGELAAAAGLDVECVHDIGSELFSPSSTTHVYVVRRAADA